MSLDSASDELRETFKRALRRFPAAVSVITSADQDRRHGMTATAVTSLSLDPPSLIVCINQATLLHDIMLLARRFCVNVLRDDQAHISDNFAGRSGVQGAAKFDCATWTTQLTGAPRVVDCLVAFDCRVTASERVGSHFVVFGSVQDIFVAGTGAPLIYANRAYGVPRRFHQRRAVRGGAAAGARCGLRKPRRADRSPGG